MSDRHPIPIRVPAFARRRGALLRAGAVMSLVPLLLVPMLLVPVGPATRAASLPPAPSSSARFT